MWTGLDSKELGLAIDRARRPPHSMLVAPSKFTGWVTRDLSTIFSFNHTKRHMKR